MHTSTQARSAPRPQPPADPMRSMRMEVLEGLRARPRRLPTKFLYDHRGSALFERICRQPEYYLTRTEEAILETHAEHIAAAIGPGVRVVEPGAGAGIKTRRLLAALRRPHAYVPVDISPAALAQTREGLAARFPDLPVRPVHADFADPEAMDVGTDVPSDRERPTLVFFPGSTLGNFEPEQAVALLRRMRRWAGPKGAVLVGVDMEKDPALLEAAYNDAAGVTAAFTLNILDHINRRLGSDFDPEGFRHRAVYARSRQRIETDLVSRRDQTVALGEDVRVDLQAGEAIRVEVSQKYSQEGLEALADAAGLSVQSRWSDARDWFSLQLLRPR